MAQRLREDPNADVQRAHIVKLAKAAGVSAAWLFGEADDAEIERTPNVVDAELEQAIAKGRWSRAVVAAARELAFPPWTKPDWARILSRLDVAIRVATSVEE